MVTYHSSSLWLSVLPSVYRWRNWASSLSRKWPLSCRSVLGHGDWVSAVFSNCSATVLLLVCVRGHCRIYYIKYSLLNLDESWSHHFWKLYMKIRYWGQSPSGSPGLSRDAAAGGEAVFEDVTDETGEDGVLSATVWQIPSHPALGSFVAWCHCCIKNEM